ncbi:hypothetical protein CFK38_07725 [Brachybacterium vulturis]|uniref:OmpR/PhoB-type domain-containing protein n=1 Tax=Brachybacterium vulturis TaxID=2017484 RepID=A0A291GMK2_9MICO|nr:BTAD domain-containing putative transcriptional regulator [Brachybacterium vulturis]ATG51428.1 hypothetical protein CFK38_07725 [Brachybacterium vulturis]
MSELRFLVLGPVEVLLGDEPLRLPSGHQQAVLACLLVHPGQVVSGDLLIEAVWPGALPANPRGALHTVISRLRSTLGEAAIDSAPGGYRLCVASGRIDAQRFEQLRREAHRAGPPRSLELFEQARALWRGPAYGEHAELGAVTAEAARLDRLGSDTLEEHAAALGECGRHGEAASVLAQLLAADPFREHAVELLMGALHDAGRPAEALERFRSYRDQLAAELGLDPGPALLALQGRILGRDPPPQPARGTDPGWSRVPPVWVDTSGAFLGRAREQQELVHLVGGNRLVTVTGVGGVGKTRLVAETLPALMQNRAAVVVELSVAVPGQVTGRVARALGLRRSRAEDIVELLSLSRLLLVLDNCEHVREEVAALAAEVARHCAGVRIVATSRHRLEVAAEQVLTVEPFAAPSTPGDEDPAVQLFAERLARVRHAADLGRPVSVQRLCRRLDGLPLAIELAASRAATIGVDAVAELLAREPGSALPELTPIVDWSVRLLTARQRDLLCRLTVFAGPFDQEAACAVAPHAAARSDPARTATDLAELVAAHLVVRRPGEEGEAEFGMLAMVRDRAIQLLEDSGEAERTREAHARWVAAVMRRGARDWIGGATAAASRRLTGRAPDVAVALRWALHAGHLDQAAEIVVPLKLHMHWLGDVGLGDLVVETAQRCASGSPGGTSSAVAAGALACAERGSTAAAQRLAHRVLAQELPPQGQALAGIAMAVATLYEGDLTGAAHWSRTVADQPRVAVGHRADAGGTLTLALVYAGEVDAARRAVRLALLGAQAAGAEAAHAFALYAAGELAVVEEPERAAALLRDAAARADEIDARHISQVARLALLAVLGRTGAGDEALEIAGPLLHDIRLAGAWPQAWTTVRLVAELLLARHRFPDAALLHSAVDLATGAPPLIAADVERGVGEQLRDALGEDVLHGIIRVSAGLSRTQVLDRAAALVAEERRA